MGREELEAGGGILLFNMVPHSAAVYRGWQLHLIIFLIMEWWD